MLFARLAFVIAVPFHTPVVIVPKVVSDDDTIDDPSVVPLNTVVPFSLSPLPDARSICSDDVHESVESTQFHVLSPSPLSTVIPAPSAAASLAAPLAISMFLSSTVIVAVLIVVVVPSIWRLPVTVRLFAMVTLLGRPTVIVPELSPTSTSLLVPENVIVPPSDVAVEVEPSVTVIALFDNLEFAIEPAS